VSHEELIDAGRRQAAEGPLDLAARAYPEKWSVLDRLAVGYIVDGLRGLGVFRDAGERQTVESVLSLTGALPAHSTLIGRWLSRLTSLGLLREDAGTYIATAPLPRVELEPLVTAAKEAFEDEPRFVEFVNGCGTNFEKILRGRESVLALLFPHGSFETADAIYRHSPVARYMNGIIRSIVDRRARSGVQRILEIGAGTGGTTASVVPILPADATEYWFTDVSDEFLARGAREFDRPFMRFGLLDIARDAQPQGYPAGGFDVVIAVNVLHATRDLRETLLRVRTLLAPGGTLLVLEATDYLAYFDLTFGFIEGWGLSNDVLRHDTPLLCAEEWVAALTSTGFVGATAIPGSGSPAAAFGEHVIVAAVPGGVLERESRPAVEAPRYERRDEAAAGALAGGRDFRAALTEMLDGERHEAFVGFVRDQVLAIMRAKGTRTLDPDARLMDAGLDSLMSIELRDRLMIGLGLEEALPATLLFDYPTIDGISSFLARTIVKDNDATSADTPDAVRPDWTASAAAGRIAQLSDEEAEALLVEKLKAM
jgi:SAM-dependent methyltransferase